MVMKGSKKTLSGVKSESTKEMFKLLRKRGFQVSLEPGNNKTYKILAFINGTDFVISCVDGRKPIYAKNWNRSARDWVEFSNIDDLLKISMAKSDSEPTDKQKSFFNHLFCQIRDKSEIEVKHTPPKTVIEMSDAIQEALLIDESLSNDRQYRFNGEYIYQYDEAQAALDIVVAAGLELYD